MRVQLFGMRVNASSTHWFCRTDELRKHVDEAQKNGEHSSDDDSDDADAVAGAAALRLHASAASVAGRLLQESEAHAQLLAETDGPELE
jgi:hypothetical protein